MSDAAAPKVATDPTEPRLAETETKLVTNPIGSDGTTETKSTSTEEPKAAPIGFAGYATNTASNAAAGVKDSVFSMFGGGPKKEKKDDEDDKDDKDEPSGSSKAQKKDAENSGAKKDDEDEVRPSTRNLPRWILL